MLWNGNLALNFPLYLTQQSPFLSSVRHLIKCIIYSINYFLPTLQALAKAQSSIEDVISLSI